MKLIDDDYDKMKKISEQIFSDSLMIDWIEMLDKISK